MKHKKLKVVGIIAAILAVFIAGGLAIFFSLNSRANIIHELDVGASAKNHSTEYNLEKTKNDITIKLNNIYAGKRTVFIWLSAEGLPQNRLLFYLNNCIITDDSGIKYNYASGTDENAVKLSVNSSTLAANEKILKFQSGIPHSIENAEIAFDFGEYGIFVFENINIELTNSEVYELGGDRYSFGMPGAKYTILAIEYSPEGVYFTMQYDLTDYYTQLLDLTGLLAFGYTIYGGEVETYAAMVPSEITGNSVTIIEDYYLPRVVEDRAEISIDLYLRNNGETYVNHLTTISFK